MIYPLFDVAAAVTDFRTSGAARPQVLLYINMALSLLTAIGLAVTVTSGTRAFCGCGVPGRSPRASCS